MNFYASCPGGLESFLTDELKEIGITSPRMLTGQVAWQGDMESAYRVCMYSRLASSVFCMISTFECETSDDLYKGVQEINWDNHLHLKRTFAVDAKGSTSSLTNSNFSALKAKDAICDQFIEKCGMRPRVDAKHPDLTINLRLRQHHATLGINMSGSPLFNRGYERPTKIQALRSDYAAAILRVAEIENSVVIPFSGGGSLLTEALLTAKNFAPGLSRSTWGFQNWKMHDGHILNTVVSEASKTTEESSLNIYAYDFRSGFTQSAFSLMHAANITEAPTFSLENIPNNATILADLSWLYADDVIRIAQVVKVLSQIKSEDSTIVAFGRNDVLKALGLTSNNAELYPVQLGRDDASISKMAFKNYSSVGANSMHVLIDASDQFASRLEKRSKELAKEAEKEDVTCYRVYDQDLPDYNVAIDIYETCGKFSSKYLVISEFVAPKEIDPSKAKARLIDVINIASDVLGVSYKNIIVKYRGKDDLLSNKHPKDKKFTPTPKRIEEGGLIFEVNLDSHLDTGIFLDHRPVRSQIREMAKEMQGSRRFLNLFSYTGTASVYAADGGAYHITNVDVSNTYLEWSQKNIQINGFDDVDVEYVRADVIRWVSEQRHSANRWDLIYVDPPTFSDSKKMKGVFDVAQDHKELIIGVSRLLTKNGVCIFSCNLRNFKPDTDGLAAAGVTIEDITDSTIPFDFARSLKTKSKIHHAYIVRRDA